MAERKPAARDDGVKERRAHEPHVTNGAEATNLPPDADMPDLTDPDPDETIKQAKRDLDEGQVDTDMRSTPGLDAGRKQKLLDDEKKTQKR